MSDVSLYSSLYDPILEYAGLVEEVLTKVKEGTSSPEEASCQKLAKFLTNLSDDKWDELRGRLVALMLNERDEFAARDWAKVGNALLSGKVDDFVMDSLENLAESLQHKHAETATRMGVWPR
jgi:hypothetical protein